MAKIDVSTIEKFLKNSVRNLKEGEDGTYRLVLNESLALYVGWENGFDANDATVIHDKTQPTWAIFAAMKVHTSDYMQTDMEYISYAYDKNGDVYDIGVSIEPDEDYNALAKYFYKEYEKMKDWEISDDGEVLSYGDGALDEGCKKSRKGKKMTEGVGRHSGVKIICELGDYTPWSGARSTWDLIEKAGKIDALDDVLADLFPEGIGMTELNDILWFEPEEILEALGISEDSDLDEAVEKKGTLSLTDELETIEGVSMAEYDDDDVEVRVSVKLDTSLNQDTDSLKKTRQEIVRSVKEIAKKHGLQRNAEPVKAMGVWLHIPFSKKD